MMSLSCFDGNYRAWGRLIAQQDLAVAMIDFRNSLIASSAPEIVPFTADSGFENNEGCSGSVVIVP